MKRNWNNKYAGTRSSGDGWFRVHSSGGQGAVVSAEIPIGGRKGDGQINLMLVDDHAILRHGLKRSLQDCDDIEVGGEAATGEELLKSVTTCRPQVVVLNVDPSNASGHTLIGQIKKMFPPCGVVVVLTKCGHVRYALDSLRNRADGFVLKSSSFSELLEAIRTVARGKTYVCSELVPELIGWISSPRKSVLENLSKREFEVLTRVGKGLSLRAAGAQLGISYKTVSTYQTRLMEKLNLYSKTELIKFALQSGLIN